MSDDRFFAGLTAALAAARAATPGLHAWCALRRTLDSCQALLQGRDGNALDCYQDRTVSETTYSMQVYALQEDGASMGMSTATVDPRRPLPAQIAAALAAARLARNPPWPLPAPPAVPYPEVCTADPAIVADPAGEQARLLALLRREAAALEGVRMNSAEAYVNRRSLAARWSTGIAVAKSVSDVYVEVAVEPLPGPNRQEVNPFIEAVGVDGLELPVFLRRVAEEARALGKTELPRTTEQAVVLVDAEAVTGLLHELSGQFRAECEYEKRPCLLPGAEAASGPVAPGGDRLTLALDPLLPAMAQSTAFTDEGLPAERAVMIEDGVVRRQLVSTRFGHYLGRPANGICGNLVVPAGTRSREELLASAPEVLEIITFSSLLVNPQTLSWSSEIKLGRLYRDGRPVALVKGGVVSGNLRDNLRDCTFSRDLVTRNFLARAWYPARGYRGPGHLLIRAGVKIAGG